jgi:hypothetical protein
MSSFEKNAITIASYLEDKMSLEEEMAFMQELEHNEELRQQYEDELMVSALLDGNSENDIKQFAVSDNLLLQSADAHLKMIGAALEKKAPQKNTGLLINILKDYRTVAAASLLIILLSVFFIFYKKTDKNLVATNKKSILKYSAKEGDSIIQAKQPLAETRKIQQGIFLNKENAKNIFEKHYNTYSGSASDPVEINEYYYSYKNGDYSKVLSATGADYQLMGSSERTKLLEQYMQLYKGLAYLAENKPDEAIQKFDIVLQPSLKTTPQYYEAQWYYMLALLKKEDVDNASNVANIIASSASSYKIKASQVLKDLQKKP